MATAPETDDRLEERRASWRLDDAAAADTGGADAGSGRAKDDAAVAAGPTAAAEATERAEAAEAAEAAETAEAADVDADDDSVFCGPEADVDRGRFVCRKERTMKMRASRTGER